MLQVNLCKGSTCKILRKLYNTLLDIIMVRRALLLELMATLRVVAWRSTSTVCNTESLLVKDSRKVH